MCLTRPPGTPVS
ncbi:hypothetical protein F383_29810 [Gossypium arboreum]|uniref:Uncharacterized protein n=1 Tax=Gossypium arboreum TaxID=29729 RepID=A0A0B0MQH1_GOSAR|nr:hypothetical protein F383_29810 [Gossypium arboreum]